MALASSGSLLYILKLFSSPTEEDAAVATFDTVNKRLLPREAHLAECQGATLLPLRADRQLLVICGGDSTVHFLQIGRDGSAEDDFMLTIPPLPIKTIAGPRVGRNDREESFVQSALTAYGSSLLLAKWDGRVAKIDVDSRRLTLPAGGPSIGNTRIMQSATCVSPDGALWYLAARSLATNGSGNERILVLDTRTLAVRSTITPVHPFWSMTIGSDGQELYATEPESDAIHVLNAQTGEEIRTLGSQSPSNAVRSGPTFLLILPARAGKSSQLSIRPGATLWAAEWRF